MSSGGPSPAASVLMPPRAALRPHRGEPKPGRVVAAAGGGKEVDTQVQVVADLQPARPEGRHARRQVARHALPGRLIGAQQRVRAPARLGEAAAVRVQKHVQKHVDLGAVADRQPQPRRAGWQVEVARLEPLEQARGRGVRRLCARGMPSGCHR
jgi:hypothetical protein